MPFDDYLVVRKPKKAHPCAWCKGIIQAGEVHRKWVGKYEGDFQSWRVHEDCISPMEQMWDANSDGYICQERHGRGKSCEESHG